MIFNRSYDTMDIQDHPLYLVINMLELPHTGLIPPDKIENMQGLFAQ